MFQTPNVQKKEPHEGAKNVVLRFTPNPETINPALGTAFLEAVTRRNTETVKNMLKKNPELVLWSGDIKVGFLQFTKITGLEYALLSFDTEMCKMIAAAINNPSILETAVAAHVIKATTVEYAENRLRTASERLNNLIFLLIEYVEIQKNPFLPDAKKNIELNILWTPQIEPLYKNLGEPVHSQLVDAYKKLHKTNPHGSVQDNLLTACCQLSKKLITEQTAFLAQYGIELQSKPSKYPKRPL